MKPNTCSTTLFTRHLATPTPPRLCRFVHRPLNLCRLHFVIYYVRFAITWQLFATCYLRFAIFYLRTQLLPKPDHAFSDC